MEKQNHIIIGNKSFSTRSLWLVFLVWPLAAFVLSWKNLEHKSSFKIILSFFALYGLTYVINPTMDGARRAQSLLDAHQNPFSNFEFSFFGLFETSIDFIDPLIINSVSLFTDFHGILFAVYAIIFGYFYLKYVSDIHNTYVVGWILPNALLFFVLLAFTNTVLNIGGFRMWLGAWVFVLGVYQYLKYKNYKFILLSAASVFVHFSYLPLVIVFIGYVILGNWPFYYAVAAFITLFIAEINLDMVREYASFLGPYFEQRVTVYTHEGYIERRGELASSAAWFVSLSSRSIRFFVLISLGIVYYHTKGNTDDSLFNSMFSLSLITLSFANIASQLPGGGRFYTVFYIFAFSTLFIYHISIRPNEKLTQLNVIGIPIALLLIAIILRIGFETISVYLLCPLLLMPLGIFFDVSLYEVLF